MKAKAKAKAKAKIKIAVIGGGVIGITTAIILRLAGYRPTVFTNFDFVNFNPNKPWESISPGFNKDDEDIVPEIAQEISSLHGAASVIPHTVSIQAPYTLAKLTTISQLFFNRLYFSAKFGVRNQLHFELYEDLPVDNKGEPKPPDYAQAVRNFEMLPTDGAGIPVMPRRPNSVPIFGWHFETYFAEAPVYMKSLYEYFKSISGKFSIYELPPTKVLKIEEILELKGEFKACVLCLGARARSVLEGEQEFAQIHRGHYIKLKTQNVPRMKNLKGKFEESFFSYNYTPKPEAYPKNIEKTEAADCYFYPRSDGWVLGGSRQLGKVKIKNNKVYWEGVQTYSEKILIPGHGKIRSPEQIQMVETPAPILNLNAEIILETSGIDIKDMEKFAEIGYRFSRTKGVRLELEVVDELPLVYNYGHGGSGYTLSWGCAIEVVKMLNRHFKNSPSVNSQKLSGGTGNAVNFSLLSDLTQKLVIENDSGDSK